jgi:hypothetical protein
MSKSHKARERNKTLVNKNFNPDFLRIDIDSYLSYPKIEPSYLFKGGSLTQDRLNYLLINKEYWKKIIRKFLTSIAKSFNHYHFKVSLSILYEYYDLNVGHNHPPVTIKKTNKKAFLDFKIFLANGNKFLPLGILNDDKEYQRLIELEYENEDSIEPSFILEKAIDKYQLRFNVDFKNFYYNVKAFNKLACAKHSRTILTLIEKLKRRFIIPQNDYFLISYIYEDGNIKFYLIHDNLKKNRIDVGNLYDITEDEKQVINIFNDKNFIFTSEWYDEQVKTYSLEDIIMIASVLKY